MRVSDHVPEPGYVRADPFGETPEMLDEQLRASRKLLLIGPGVCAGCVAIIVGAFAVLSPGFAGVVACASLGTVGLVGVALTVLGIKMWSSARTELAAYPSARQVSPRG